MNAALWALVALLGIVWLLAALIVWTQAAGRVNTALRVQALDVSALHKDAALLYFQRAGGIAPIWRAVRDQLLAPIVLLIPLLRLPREANDLPDSLAYWRNNVGINGDGFGWQDAAGRWHQSRAEPEPPGVEAIKYDDPRYAGDAYYAPGHHPRSWYARWIWLAWRNVATARLQVVGPLVTTPPQLLSGALPLSNGQTGHALLWNGRDGADAAYQWRSIDRWGPLALWTNVGAKLDIPYQWPEMLPVRAMITGTWRAVKWWSAK